MSDTIITKLSEKDYIKISFLLIYKRIAIKIFLFFLALMMLLSITGMLLLSSFNSSTKVDFELLKSNLLILIFAVVFNFIVYKNAKQQFLTNKRANEQIEYSFDDTNVYIKGESFSSQFSWDKIYKVEKLNNWLLLYHNKLQMSILAKKSISERNYQFLKQTITKNNISNNL